MSATNLPNLTVLLAILKDKEDGLSADQILSAFEDQGAAISRPTLNRLLVQGRDQGLLTSSGLTNGRMHRLATVSEVAESNEHTASAAILLADGAQQDIVSAYGARVWSTADVLRGVGIKQSEWPQHMMPFFALMLLESRVLRIRSQAMEEMFDGGTSYDVHNPDRVADLSNYYIAKTPGTNSTFHKGLLFHGEGMVTISKGGASGLGDRLRTYLAGFDQRTQQLLGCSADNQEKFLGINESIKTLNAKGSDHLSQWVSQWSRIDLAAYESGAITTLEEHIKRKWADISADTAGEQYTPFDLFTLVSDLGTDHFERHPTSRDTLTIYDPTCGGGNMLYGIGDRLRVLGAQQDRHLEVRERGQEINDTLYALASVEARFRADADIKYGNTLTADQFTGETFDLIVANPPYGVDWKGAEQDIKRDLTGRFPEGCSPPVSDGQHLFFQHILAHLAEHGLAFVFSSGSTLFSGDAGGGESNARMKYFQTDDDVMGVIQLPKDEFFNTGINTYLWIFKKNKPESLKGRAFFLDASNMATKLRKSLGSKRVELADEARKVIVGLVAAAELMADDLTAGKRGKDGRKDKNMGLALVNPEEGDFTVAEAKDQSVVLRLLSVDEICYTRLNLELTRGQPALKEAIGFSEAEITILPKDMVNTEFDGIDCVKTKLSISTDMDMDEAIEKVARFEVAVGSAMDLDDRIQELQSDPKKLVSSVKAFFGDYPMQIVGFVGKFGGKKASSDGDRMMFAWNHPGQPQEHTVYQIDKTWKGKDLGRAALAVTAKIKAGKGWTDDRLILTIGFEPETEKDTETVPFSGNQAANQELQATFLGRWVHDPYTIIASTVGCEVNFNRLFPKTAERKTLADVQAEIAAVDAEIAKLLQEKK